ncbi:unnamed protein product, partial [marine sediment metagenome]
EDNIFFNTILKEKKKKSIEIIFFILQLHF